MIAERFVREYASYKKKQIMNSLMSNVDKKLAIHKVDAAVRNRDRGLIYADEAVKLIMEIY